MLNTIDKQTPGEKASINSERTGTEVEKGSKKT